jgi:hypothetical protein
MINTYYLRGETVTYVALNRMGLQAYMNVTGHMFWNRYITYWERVRDCFIKMLGGMI